MMKTRRRNIKRKVKLSRRSKKGGFGGWSRITTVGPAWNGQNSGNHFKLSPNGVVVGGIQPAIPEGSGWDHNTGLYPPLSQKALSSGGSKRSRRSTSLSHKKGRSKRGGLTLGGFPNDIQIALANAKIYLENGYRGIMGLNPLVSASPWVQPGLESSKVPNMQASKPYVIDAARSMMQKH